MTWWHNCLLVIFRHTKTIQFGQRQSIIPVLKIKNSKLGPVLADKRMMEMVLLSGCFPAFSIPVGDAICPITYTQFHSFLKNHLESAGIDASRYSSHSFHRGGATWAFRSGLAPELVQILGDWQSDAYRKYVKLDVHDRFQLAEKMVHRLHVGL